MADLPPVIRLYAFMRRLTLEICTESLECALAAERAGAHRIELCAEMAAGGITPSAGLIQSVRKRLRIPVHVLVRPRPGNFCYSAREIEVMQRDILFAKRNGLDGVVLGVLARGGAIDWRRTRELVRLARPMPVTFHHAFDCADASVTPEEALECLVEAGAHRLLTSGRHRRAAGGLNVLGRLAEAARGRIAIMAGGGITPQDVPKIVAEGGILEVHTSVGVHVNGGRGFAPWWQRGNGQDSSAFACERAYERRVKQFLAALARS